MKVIMLVIRVNKDANTRYVEWHMRYNWRETLRTTLRAWQVLRVVNRRMTEQRTHKKIANHFCLNEAALSSDRTAS